MFRIYIKKVKKFIGFAVDPNLDRKQLKAAMDQAFQALKECGMDSHGEERSVNIVNAQSCKYLHLVGLVDG